MFQWQKQVSKGWIAFGLILFLCLPPIAWAGSAALRHLEQRYHQKSAYVRNLHLRRQNYLSSVLKAARSLALLKKQAERKGLLGIPARMRLPNARAAAEDLVKKIKRLDRRLTKHNNRLKRMRRKLKKWYRLKMTTLQQQRRKIKEKKQRLALLQRWQSYRLKFERLSKDAPRLTRRALPHLRVSIDPLDGPVELRQKADVLKDQEDRIKNRMQKLQRQLRKVRQRYTRERQDQKLAQRVRRMTSEDDLFNEGERSPRVTTGARTSERMRTRGGRNTTRPPANPTPTANAGVKSGSSAPKKSGTSGQSESASADRNTTPQAPPNSAAAPSNSKGTGSNTSGSSMGSKAPGQSGGYSNNGRGSTANPTPGRDSDKSGVKTTTQTQRVTAQPRLGYGPGATIHNGDPLNPTGTLAQQLQALKRYQQALRQRALQLRKKQQQFLSRAKKLQRQEKRRRRR